MVIKEVLQITEKRREAKGKGEKERYSHLNAELERTARRVKKAFLSEQCKEIEENNRIGRTRGLFKKIRDAHVYMKCSFGISDFLKEISSLSHCCFPLFLCIVHLRRLSYLSCYSLELFIQILISFLFSFAFHFSSFHSYL